MLRRLLWVLLVLASPSAFGQFEPLSLDRLDLLQREGTSTTVITPIYSQMLLFSLPDEFHALVATAHKGKYTQQSVLANESAARWTQMITVTGDEALAFSGRSWPQQMVDAFASRLKKSCPDSFAMLPVKDAFVGSFDTAVVVAACGSVGGRSEAALQLVVKGGMDIYTIEWAVRGPATKGPPKLELAQWTERLRRLAPIRICRIVPSEPPPYPSCLRRR